jgi:hypothetical protein
MISPIPSSPHLRTSVFAHDEHALKSQIYAAQAVPIQSVQNPRQPHKFPPDVIDLKEHIRAIPHGENHSAPFESDCCDMIEQLSRGAEQGAQGHKVEGLGEPPAARGLDGLGLEEDRPEGLSCRGVEKPLGVEPEELLA